MYSIRSSPGIRSEISWGGSIVVPRRGTIFGCARCFHTTVTWWKACGIREGPGAEKLWHRRHTSLTLCGFPFECVRTRLIRTFDPLNVPSYTHPRSESESLHAFGRTLLTPHILFSSPNSSRNGALLGPEVSQRTCAGGERGTERNGAEAHIVQIVDEPNQILALQTWDSIFVFVPAEEVGELVVEIRRGSVEIAEFLQEI